MKIKKVVVLGSTGSIGINTLDVIARFPQHFRVEGLTAYNNLELLEEQVRRFSPRYVAVGEKGIPSLKAKLHSHHIKFLSAESDLEDLVALKSVDIVVIGMSGGAALKPFLKAVQSGKVVAPANKEALVMAGSLIMQEAGKHKAVIIPVDSEQSAIFQCLHGNSRGELKRVYLTASGGPLRTMPAKNFQKLTVADILKHPRWKMGKKITVDSATLMNKGFEAMEAQWLFDLDIAQIDVVVHPEAIIHSMVSFRDGSILAQLGVTDMRLPIQYALTYPRRWDTGLADVDFFKLKQLTFAKPDLRKFPSLALAFHVAAKGGTLPAVLNAADEEIVQAFLSGKILFPHIYRNIEKIVLSHRPQKNPSLEDILAADLWARERARGIL